MAPNPSSIAPIVLVCGVSWKVEHLDLLEWLERWPGSGSFARSACVARRSDGHSARSIPHRLSAMVAGMTI